MQFLLKINLIKTVMSYKVIHLDRSLSREKQFKLWNSHLDFDFFSATDGTHIDADSDSDFIKREDYHLFPKGALGSSHSWYRILREIVKGTENVVVFEDDAITHREFDKHLESIELPEDFDMIYLSYNTDAILITEPYPGQQLMHISKKPHPSKEMVSDFQHAKIYPGLQKLHTACGVSAVLVSPAGAKKTLSLCYPLEKQYFNLLKDVPCITIDCFICKHMQNGLLDNYILLPSISLTTNHKEESLNT